ncbi:hypothetical protein Tco_1570027 [Tanacetum coccineum]
MRRRFRRKCVAVVLRVLLLDAVLPCVSALRLVARDRADTHFLNRMWHATYLVYSISSKPIRADRLYHLVSRYCRTIMDCEWSRGSIGKSGLVPLGWNNKKMLAMPNSDRFVVPSKAGLLSWTPTEQ